MSDPIVLYDYLKRYTRHPGRQRCFSYSTRFIYFVSVYVRVVLYGGLRDTVNTNFVNRNELVSFDL